MKLCTPIDMRSTRPLRFRNWGVVMICGSVSQEISLIDGKSVFACSIVLMSSSSRIVVVPPPMYIEWKSYPSAFTYSISFLRCTKYSRALCSLKRKRWKVQYEQSVWQNGMCA